jgi:hypothetical protein
MHDTGWLVAERRGWHGRMTAAEEDEEQQHERRKADQLIPQ